MIYNASVLAHPTLLHASASGLLVDVVNLNRDDGALELTELRYDLSGNYSCRVELSNGEAESAAPWEVLIVGELCHTLHDNALLQ